jgi:serine/threonine protein kinase
MESSQPVTVPRYSRILSIDVMVGQERRPRRSFIEPSRLLLGRLPTSDILFGAKEQTVSSTHAEITQLGGRFVLRDLESRNGLWVPSVGDSTGVRIKELSLDEAEEPKDVTLGPAGPLCRISVGYVVPFADYLVTGQLGEGGMATVFMARKAQGSERPVVLKLIAQSLLLSIDPREAKAMFEQEARLSSFVSDANVVNIFDTGCWEGTHYIAMEYLRGVNLSSVLRQLHRRGLRCPFPLAAALVSRACLGLHAAHEARDETGEQLGIVHRDFTPTNLMCTPDGDVKLIDFGVARALGKRSLASRGQFVGKPAYAAPEQIRSPQEVDRRTDIFAAGVILYELCAGTSLFHRATEFATMDAVLSDPIPQIPEAPAVLQGIIHRALCREPSGRHQTAAQLAEELERFTLGTNGELMRRGAVAAALSKLGVDLQPAPPRPLTARPSLFPTPLHGVVDKAVVSPPRPSRPVPTPLRATPQAPQSVVLGEHTCVFGATLQLHQEKGNAALLAVCYAVEITTAACAERRSGTLYLISGEQAWSPPRAEVAVKISRLLEQMQPLLSTVMLPFLFAGEAWSGGPFALLFPTPQAAHSWQAAQVQLAGDPEARLALLRELCSALFVIRQQLPQFVHGQLSPTQIEIRWQASHPQVLLTVGPCLAALLGTTPLGSAGTPLTTPYLAPELLESAASSASDVFSLGMLGYELLGGDMKSADLAVRSGGLPPPIPPCIKVPLPSRDILMESLRAQPYLRPSDAALCRALGNAQTDSPRTLLPIQIPRPDSPREITHPDGAKLWLASIRLDKQPAQGLRMLPFSQVPHLLPAPIGLQLFRGLLAIEMCAGERASGLGGGGHRLYGEGAVTGDKRLLLLEPSGYFEIGSRSQRRLQRVDYQRVVLRKEVAIDLPPLGIRMIPEEDRLSVLLWTRDVRSGDHHLVCVQIME